MNALKTLQQKLSESKILMVNAQDFDAKDIMLMFEDDVFCVGDVLDLHQSFSDMVDDSSVELAHYIALSPMGRPSIEEIQAFAGQYREVINTVRERYDDPVVRQTIDDMRLYFEQRLDAMYQAMSLEAGVVSFVSSPAHLHLH